MGPTTPTRRWFAKAATGIPAEDLQSLSLTPPDPHHSEEIGMSSPVQTERIAEAARERLAASPYSSIRRIDCSYADGVLVLSGEVSSYYEKQLAQSVLIGMEGVEQIANQLSVRGAEADD
jgi:osmotically-inducible protein OsmY